MAVIERAGKRWRVRFYRVEDFGIVLCAVVECEWAEVIRMLRPGKLAL
jgi:hypothetical protein